MTEDIRFYDHSGVDLRGLLRAGYGVFKNVFMLGNMRKIQHGDEWNCEPQYLYLEMDLRNTESVLVNLLKKILKNLKKKYQILLFGTTGMVGRLKLR